MQLRPFSLLPEGHPLATVTLEAEVTLRGDSVFFEFSLQGKLAAVRFGSGFESGAGSPAARADGLWQATCFEAFVRQEGREGYLEFNVAPSGRWNCYRFDGYRQGMRPESAIQSLAIRAENDQEHAILSWSVPLAALGGLPETLRMGLTAVLEDAAGGLSYWAIDHAGDKPDFHRQESFIARLPE